MSALVIEAFPDALHAKLQQMAASHQRSVPQETILLIKIAIAAQEKSFAANGGTSKWANRKLLPEYEAMLASGAFQGAIDATQIISDERDAR